MVCVGLCRPVGVCVGLCGLCWSLWSVLVSAVCVAANCLSVGTSGWLVVCGCGVEVYVVSSLEDAFTCLLNEHIYLLTSPVGVTLRSPFCIFKTDFLS